jgi:glycosyltransferase involved in cell wall biosynthesis
VKYEVTIGIPVFNAEKYIRQTMDSVLAQTFVSIEFLILDDCCSDRSMDIIRDYQHQHPRGKDIRIVSQPQNMGVGKARNRLVDEAQGHFLYFIDADDTIVPNTIELLHEHANKYQAEIVYGSYEFVENDQILEKRYSFHQFSREGDFAQYAYRHYDGIQSPVWNMLIDINVFRHHHLRFQPINFWEDFTLTMDLPTYVNQVVLLPDITYRYYRHAGSLSRNHHREKIEKTEILETIQAIEVVKRDSDRIKDKPFYSKRMLKVMMTDFYIVCSILRNQKVIVPSFTQKELRDIMNTPLSLGEILRFKTDRWKNIALYLIGVMPPIWSVYIIFVLGKLKRLI